MKMLFISLAKLVLRFIKCRTKWHSSTFCVNRWEVSNLHIHERGSWNLTLVIYPVFLQERKGSIDIPNNIIECTEYWIHMYIFATCLPPCVLQCHVYDIKIENWCRCYYLTWDIYNFRFLVCDTKIIAAYRARLMNQ